MGSHDGSSWTPTVPSNACERIRFRANVNSPQPAVLNNLRLGDELDVRLQTVPTIAVMVLHLGTPVGALTGMQVSQLIGCIQNGFEYSATIVSIDRGNWTVEISHK